MLAKTAKFQSSTATRNVAQQALDRTVSRLSELTERLEQTEKELQGIEAVTTKPQAHWGLPAASLGPSGRRAMSGEKSVAPCLMHATLDWN
jgi:hypothetical protein